MSNCRNYQRELDRIISENEKVGRVPTLLLHSCCAPCSSYCLEYLSDHFRITDFYYNPNITDQTEYEHRTEELERLIREQPHKYEVTFAEGPYEPKLFFETVKGYERCPEGTQRCALCFGLRLKKSCLYAASHHFDYVTTTLTISPMKDADVLNSIGERCTDDVNRELSASLKWLPSNFKKKGGYQRSTELSGQYHLYRQNYCGCVFSKRHDYVKLRNHHEGAGQSPALNCI